MEMVYLLFMGVLGAVVLPLGLILSAAIGGYVTVRVIQSVEPAVSKADAAAIARAWRIALALGGAGAALFFAYALAVTLTWEYLRTGIFMAIGFAVVGALAGMIGVRRMFQRLGSVIPQGDGTGK